MYTVNKRTKEHRLYDYGDECSEYQDIVQADADGWIEWHGRECPLPDGHPVELRFSTGETTESRCPSRWSWSPDGNAMPIIAYRPIIEPQAPEWAGEGVPPVGTVCEALWNESCREYLRTEVFGVDEHGQPIHRFEEGPKKHQYRADVLVTSSGTKVFRPIRPIREKWVAAVMGIYHANDSVSVRDAMGDIYDALKSGDLPQP